MTKFPFPALIDSTQLSTFDACEHKWMYEHGHHLSPLAINPHLHAGGAFSRGIEVVREGFYKHGYTQEKAFIAGIKAISQFWGDFVPPPKNPKTYEAMIGALESYLEEYPLAEDDYKPLMLPEGPAVEFTFSIPTQIAHPTTGSPILFGGRFDMLASFMDTFNCVVDEKTTGSFGPSWVTQWGMRGQFIGYCFAARYYGYNTSMAVIRGVAIQKTQYKHIQAIEQYSDWQMKRWWEETNFKIARMVRAWENNEFTHSYGDACGSYGGCVFLTDLCTREHPEEAFGNYQVRVWNPLEKDPTWPEDGPEYEVIGNIKDLLP